MDETITYVGLDVHKETIAVALADGVCAASTPLILRVCDH